MLFYKKKYGDLRSLNLCSARPWFHGYSFVREFKFQCYPFFLIFLWGSFNKISESIKKYLKKKIQMHFQDCYY